MNILSAGFFFATAWWLGLTLVRQLKFASGAIRLFAGLIVGITVLTEVVFWQSWWLPFSREYILATLTATVIICSWQWRKNLKHLNICVNKKTCVNWLIWTGGWLLLYLFIWSRMLRFEADGLYAGWVNIWGDWAAHLTYTASFAYGDNFPPQMPILIGAKFSYPFMADFLPAILIKLGAELIPAMLIPSVILSLTLVILLTGFGQLIHRSFLAGKITTMLFLFNGGLGWWWWLKDIRSLGLVKVIENLPREYTHLEKLANIEWINIITSQVIPQRGFLFGFPAAVLAYYCLWQYRHNHQRKTLLAAGLLTALLPLIHSHSVAIISVVGGAFSLMELWRAKNKFTAIKNWLWFFLPILVIGGPPFFYFFGSSVTNGNFINWFPGWLAIQRGDSFLWFWVKNLGLMAILPLLGLFIGNKRLRSFSLPFWLIFFGANLWLFQPWEWDNTKFFSHWYLLACVLAAGWLSRLPRVTKTVILFLAIWAGILDVWRLTQYPHRKIRFWTNDQLQLAEWVKINTPPEAKFLTADNHDHWLAALTGRKTLLGYRGWLWTYGLNYQNQEQAAKIIFQGKPQARDKIKEYGLNYAVIGPLEKEIKPKINHDWFRQNFPLAVQSGATQIYSLVD